jgi:hypothetical protein
MKPLIIATISALTMALTGTAALAAPVGHTASTAHAGRVTVRAHGQTTGLAILGTAPHRLPIAGEAEPVTWTITNAGQIALGPIVLMAGVPRSWSVRPVPGCVRAGDAERCLLGSLAPGAHRAVTIRAVARRPLGPVRLWARSRFGLDGMALTGPRASFGTFVVTHR